jgi:hypothetical protein
MAGRGPTAVGRRVGATPVRLHAFRPGIGPDAVRPGDYQPEAGGRFAADPAAQIEVVWRTGTTDGSGRVRAVTTARGVYAVAGASPRSAEYAVSGASLRAAAPALSSACGEECPHRADARAVVPHQRRARVYPNAYRDR